MILLSVLIGNEFYEVCFGEPLKYPYVDSSNPDERIRVNLNITFHSVPCKALSVDY